MIWAPIEYVFMKLVIVFSTVSVILLISAFICVNRFDKQFFTSHEDFPEERQPFSVPDYLDRMEKLHLKTLQERENEEPHIIVLWWGFDGLRLNLDGTTEWISRRPKEDKPKATLPPTYGCTYEEFSTIAGDMFSVPYLTVYDSANYLQPTTLDDCSATWKIPSKEAQIAALQSQLQAVNMQQWQNEQIQSMINVIEPGRDINGRLRRYG